MLECYISYVWIVKTRGKCPIHPVRHVLYDVLGYINKYPLNMPVWLLTRVLASKDRLKYHYVKEKYTSPPTHSNDIWAFRDLDNNILEKLHMIYAKCTLLNMMTSSNGNIFRVTGHLCGKFTGPRWISRTKASDAELWCFLWFTPE